MTARMSDAGASVEFCLDELCQQIESAHIDTLMARGRSLEVLVAVGTARARIGDPFRLRETVDDIIAAPGDDGQPGDTLRLAFSGRPGRPLVMQVGGVVRLPENAVDLISRMGGTLDEQPGRGFRITLPYESVDVAESEAPAAPDAGTSLQGLRFLIADDSQTNLMVIREMLANTGATMTTVTNGREAIEAWQDNEFDLMLLDIAMPELDGMSALQYIRAAEDAENRPHVPAIAVTANVMPHQVAQYIIAGFDTHLSKPFRRSELIGAILAVNTAG